MKRAIGFCAWALWGVVGCGETGEGVGNDVSPGVGTAESAIVGGSVETGRKYVVMIEGWRYDGRVTRCSGTYFAPRVVLTAASCLSDMLVPNNLFVYYGSNYETDVAQLPDIPAPGLASVWARADSWERHCTFNSTTNDGNVGVIYLDRKLPFDPLPLYRNNIDSSFVGKKTTVLGWGADAALSADISLHSGLGVKRTATMTISGTPSSSLYDVNDPNPGLLDATVRSHWIHLIDSGATDGSRCAGDGGGPMLVNQWGQDYIAGVGFWTGLWCKDYSVMTRIDPYLPFLDLAYQKGGQATVVPRLECVTANPDGSLRAHFGYTNNNGVNVTVPYGSANVLALDTKGVRPSLFYNGKNGSRAWAFSVNFAKTQTLTYKLSPTNSPTTTINVNSSSPRCAASSLHVQCEASCRPQLAMAACPNLNPRTRQDECVANCIASFTEADAFGCKVDFASYNTCLAGIAPSAANWQCSIYSADPQPADGLCLAESDAFYTCMGLM